MVKKYGSCDITPGEFDIFDKAFGDHRYIWKWELDHILDWSHENYSTGSWDRKVRTASSSSRPTESTMYATNPEWHAFNTTHKLWLPANGTIKGYPIAEVDAYWVRILPTNSWYDPFCS